MSKIAVVLLADGFEEIEAVTPVDVLRRAGIDTMLAGVGGRTRTGARGVLFVADGEIADAPPLPDLVVLPGGLRGAENLAASPAARDYVVTAYNAGKICAAICAAPALAFASWGLLDRRRATCYPAMHESFPASARFVEEAVVVDGNVVTSRGPGTALAFSLALAGLVAGPGMEARLRRDMLAG